MIDQLSVAVRNAPLSYLPEISLSLFCRFRRGYDLRCRMEGQPHDWQLNFSSFAFWVQQRFGILDPHIESAENVILSFVTDEEQGFYRYFELVEEFAHVSESDRLRVARSFSVEGLLRAFRECPARCVGFPILESADQVDPSIKPQKRNFIEVIKALRERPSFYLGFPGFRSCCAFLLGDECAQEELRIPADDGRAVFAGFRNWVERELNRALPRPWYQVISFVGAYEDDCGHGSTGTLSRFYDLLDSYAQKIDRPDLFRVPVEWREWQDVGQLDDTSG